MAGRFVEIFTNCYGEHGLDAAVAHAASIGISHLEVALKPHGGHLVVPSEVILTEQSTPEQIRDGMARLQQAGLRCSSANIGADVSTEEGRRIVKARIDIAAQLGCRWLVGSLGHADDKRDLYDGVIEVADYAKERGLPLTLETHPPLVTNADEALATLKDLRHDNVSINWDTGNIYYYNEGIDGEDELRKIAPYVGHVHLKDSHKGYREWFFPALGGGNIDLAQVRRILADAGFQGPYSIEIEGVAGESPVTLEQRQENLRRSVQHLRSLGYLDADD
ncbi:MAG: sugar phosphate isomerase/epimerase family protein [Anaerolineae bacterium]